MSALLIPLLFQDEDGLCPLLCCASDKLLWSPDQSFRLHVDGVEVLELYDLTQAVICVFVAY